MLALVGLLGLGAFVVTSLVIGLRLVRLAATTRQLPEASMGISLLASSCIGTGALVLTQVIPDISVSASYWLIQFANAFSHIGYIALLVFVWRVFRPGEAWANALFALCLAGLLVGYVGEAVHLEVGAPAGRNAWLFLTLGARTLAYAWGSVESFRYYGLLRRRIALGLGEPQIANRFLMWGIATSAGLTIWFIGIALTALGPSNLAALESTFLLVAICGFVFAIALWLAFMPPRWYRARLAGDSGANS